MRALAQHPRLIDSPRQRELAAEWKKCLRFERSDPEPDGRLRPYFRYPHSRTEGDLVTNFRDYYPISPIDEIIPVLIDYNAKRKRKTRILDLGGGSCEYTKQLRRKFGDKVRVFSTGLSKKVAKATREELGLSKLHRDDLVCQSIEQMHNYPEFDLILSACGEAFYGTTRKAATGQFEGYDRSKLKNKLDAIIRKLNPGGFAMLSPMFYDGSQNHLYSVIDELLKENPGTLVIENYSRSNALLIHKQLKHIDTSKLHPHCTKFYE